VRHHNQERNSENHRSAESDRSGRLQLRRLTCPIIKMSTTIGSFIAGGIAACGAVSVTHSFETVKIRLQLQGELKAKQDAPRLYRGVLHGVSVIYANEGAKGLLRGLSCAVCIRR
jgi:solute carrier family 25 protein 34/35